MSPHGHDGPQLEPLKAATAAARRRRRVPAGSICARCGSGDHLVLAPDGQILCYADRRAETGIRPFEEDHIAGIVNVGGVVIRLHPNAHRTVTELRSTLGMDDWPRADGEPLLVLAHALAGIATLLWLAALWLLELSQAAGNQGDPPPPPFVV